MLRHLGKVRFAAIALLCVPTACTVGPDYAGPPDVAPANWSQTPPGREPIDRTTPWWTAFGDPVLDGLVERAVAANAGLQRARAAVEEARAAIRQARGGGAPQLNATVSALSTKQYSPPAYTPVETYGTAGFDASWELELWGKTTRAVEAAEANAGGAQATADDAMLTLLGDVARNYAELRGTQAQLAATQASVVSQRRNTQMAQMRMQGGDGTRLEILQGQAGITASEAAIPPLLSAQQMSINALSVLCGQAPNALSETLASSAPIPRARLPSLGVPADLVRRRPDVRVAERALATSVAQVGVAIANEYPSLSIAGSLSLSGASIASIMAMPVFAIGPTLHASVLDGGVKAAQVDIQKARVMQARWAYRAAVLKALQEVEDTMSRLQGETARRAKLAEAVAISAQQVRTARLLYVNGADGFFQVVDAQRGLDNARIQLAQSDTTLTVDTVAFYKALGGGWAVVHPAQVISPDAGYGNVPTSPPIRPADPIRDVGERRR